MSGALYHGAFPGRGCGKGFCFLCACVRSRAVVSSRTLSSWQSCSSWGMPGFVEVDAAPTGGIHGSSWHGCVCCVLTLLVRCELIASFSDRELVCFVLHLPPICSDSALSDLISDRSVNTFTEHRGSVWSVKDMQHT